MSSLLVRMSSACVLRLVVVLAVCVCHTPYAMKMMKTLDDEAARVALEGGLGGTSRSDLVH